MSGRVGAGFPPGIRKPAPARMDCSYILDGYVGSVLEPDDRSRVSQRLESFFTSQGCTVTPDSLRWRPFGLETSQDFGRGAGGRGEPAFLGDSKTRFTSLIRRTGYACKKHLQISAFERN
jgi:hypothetical protein